MKKIITDYTFNALTSQITFTDYSSINISGIEQIINITANNTLIFNWDNGINPGYGLSERILSGSVASNVLTLTYNTTGMNNTDILRIIYDDGIGNAYDSSNNLKTVDQNLQAVISSGKIAVQESNSASILTQLNKMIFSGNNLEVLPLRENPFSNIYGGQDICSIDESFWRRLNREGTIKTTASIGGSITPSSSYTNFSVFSTPDTGQVLYPRGIIFGLNFANSNCNTANIEVIYNFTSSLAYTVAGSVSGGSPCFNLIHDGEMVIQPGGYVNGYVQVPNTLLNNTIMAGNTTNGSNIITNLPFYDSNMKNMTIVGTGIPASTKIIGGGGTSALLSANATATNSAVSLTLTDSPVSYNHSSWGYERTY